MGAPFIAQNITASRAICAEPGERHHVAWHHRDGKKDAIFACASWFASLGRLG